MKWLLEVTRFRRPHGAQEQDHCEIELAREDWERFANNRDSIKDTGLRFTAEKIATGGETMVSLCLENRRLGDYKHAVVFNGPAVPEALRKMVMEWSPDDYARWCAHMEADDEGE